MHFEGSWMLAVIPNVENGQKVFIMPRWSDYLQKKID